MSQSQGFGWFFLAKVNLTLHLGLEENYQKKVGIAFTVGCNEEQVYGHEYK